MTDTDIQEKLIDIVIKDKVPNFKFKRNESIGQIARAKIEALTDLLQQSNREYGNWLIGKDEKIPNGHIWTTENVRGRNELRAELRKKNAE